MHTTTLLIILCILDLSICNFCPPREWDNINLSYEQALLDAKTIGSSKVRELIRLSKDNEKLLFMNNRLSGIVWSSYTGYNDLVGKTITLDRDVWITISPHLKERCKDFCLTNDFDLRMKQLLGIHPLGNNNYIVELLVDLPNLFRPCYSPEIHASQCGLEYSSGVSKDHVHWMKELEEISYLSGTGYPWTRLGYTCDWRNGSCEFGLDEFVVGRGSNVTVNTVADSFEFCCVDT